MPLVVYADESYAIMGACFEVYKQKGCGFSEEVYQQCLEIEFGLRGVEFVSKPTLELAYKGQKLEKTFQPDFICFNKVILEIKAIQKLLEINRVQEFNYLKATDFSLALLVNFGHYPQLEYQRLANEQRKSHGSLSDEVKSWLK